MILNDLQISFGGGKKPPADRVPLILPLSSPIFGSIFAQNWLTPENLRERH